MLVIPDTGGWGSTGPGELGSLLFSHSSSEAHFRISSIFVRMAFENHSPLVLNREKYLCRRFSCDFKPGIGQFYRLGRGEAPVSWRERWANERALQDGERLVSKYQVGPSELLVITE
jgi:hypothetical protein